MIHPPSKRTSKASFRNQYSVPLVLALRLLVCSSLFPGPVSYCTVVPSAGWPTTLLNTVRDQDCMEILPNAAVGQKEINTLQKQCGPEIVPKSVDQSLLSALQVAGR
ncbi:hypothetical protein B0H11DRAFT_2046085 [Mycena galericulata]|nr:hypothetical protein B0H11DRAFT_2046085 [Mycena galericulata]